ncbi:MAG TPA: DUF1453 domain-containing protein [Paenibacillus sp.]|uniref:CcdC protein domain-containing protein n=1 Tax=Paenibacillus TaxID=44249 RepID=UPI000BA04D84|nr:hypothetical protein CA599_03155 [Paenibacillus taichungensis]HBU82077.1 DUF1453 domain-containing protein [Paenibacillus sp.]
MARCIIKETYLFMFLIIVIFSIRFFDFMFISGIDPKTLGFLNNVVALSYIAIWRMASFIKFHNSKSSTIRAWDKTALSYY